MSHAFLLQTAPLAGLMDRLRFMLESAGEALSSLAVAALVVAAGGLLATLLGWLLLVLLRAIGFNGAARRAFGERWLGSHEPARLAASALRWLVWGFAGVLAIDLLGFDLSGALAARFSELLPRVFAAALILVTGSAIAMLAGALARRFFATAGLRGARLRGQIVAGVVTCFAVMVALEQLGFAAHFVMGLTLTAVAAAGLALALAVGLGCRELARDFVIEYLKAMDDEKPVSS